MADPDYFTLAEFRALPDCSGQTFTDAQINAAAAYFVAIVEREVGSPFIPRTVTETLYGNGAYGLVLSQTDVRSVTSLAVGGVTVDTTTVSATSGVLRYITSTTRNDHDWLAGATVTVTYTAGRFATCPADVKDAVMWATRDLLITQSQESGSWDRKSSETSDFGTVNYVLPGSKTPTGYPRLDAVIASYQRSTPSLGFA